MPSGRGLVVFAAGLALWLVARIAGSSSLHLVAVGVTVLPFASAAFTRWSRTRIRVHRRLTEARVAPGRRVAIEIDVENQAPATSSFLLIEDRLPSALGRPARLVLTGLHAKARRRVSYSVTPAARGRYPLGPVTVDVTDPFALTRLRVQFDHRDELIVTPEIEDLRGEAASPFGSGSGQSLSRHLFRTGEEFYTMRPYQTGDDLRRIHWPSVARVGELMIRQDESSRRSAAVLFLDTRVGVLGEIHSPGFEKAVSAAASVGVLLARSGFSLRLGTAEMPPTRIGEERMLDTLAGIAHAHQRALAPSLARLRGAAAVDTSLVVVTAPPPPGDLNGLIRAGQAYGPKVAVLVYPQEPADLPPDRQSHIEGRASVARLSLSRAGWQVAVVSPNGRLRDVWHATERRTSSASV